MASAAASIPTRPLADRLEIAAPAVAAVLVRMVGRLPAPVRRRALTDAFSRAEAAFNRGDWEAIFALFADDVHYVPPPALSPGPVTGHDAVLAFWRSTALRYPHSTIENRSLEESSPTRFVRTARLTHSGEDGTLRYDIRQVTELRRGRVVSQVNEQIG